MNAFSRPKAAPVPARRKTPQQMIGRQAEDRALTYLQEAGLKLVARNFLCKSGEIDLIMLDGNTLVFVEVRHRSSQRFGGAAASVTASKQAKLISAAQVFLKRHTVLPPCRFDLVSVDADQTGWLKNVIEV